MQRIIGIWVKKKRDARLKNYGVKCVAIEELGGKVWLTNLYICKREGREYQEEKRDWVMEKQYENKLSSAKIGSNKLSFDLVFN